VGTLHKCAVTSQQLRVLAIILALLGLALGAGCRGEPAPFLTGLDEARRLTADVRVQFSKAADASNRAVMADTDEASIGFAHDAEQATKAVSSDLALLGPLLEQLGFQSEQRELTQFEKRFSDYQALDRTVLALAVENTNLKAQRLSFGPARAAADKFRDALGSLAPAAAAQDRCHVEQLVDSAVLAVREVQVLQAPHIAEPDDAAMLRMETEMAALQAAAKGHLSELAGLAPASARPALADAQTALEQFASVSAQIVALSRRNTNVRSLDLALRSKPPLTTACDDSLRVLQAALANKGSKATR
jgi:hypothetical protein